MMSTQPDDDRVDDARSSARPSLAPAPAAADVGIVAAMPMEIGHLLDGLRGVRKYHAARLSVFEGEHQGKTVVVTAGGVGRDRARRATELLIAGHRPSWALSVGFAGALSAHLERNDLVFANEVIDLEGGRFAVAPPPETIVAGTRCRPGRLLTVDRVVVEQAEKQRLHEEHQADLIDMETAAVAAVCEERRTRFLAARVISDDAHNDLPLEIATLLTRSGSYRVGAALRAVLGRPSSIKDFWRLHEQALDSADRLAGFVLRCIAELSC